MPEDDSSEGPATGGEIENLTVEPPAVPIVAIGASAGGLEALKSFLDATPDDTGACFVFVQHLDPTHKSMLPELLSRCTSMQVLQASDNLEPRANTVVLIPPDATLTYDGGLLHIIRPAPPRQHRLPIDSFFESIALSLGPSAICVVLSGTGSDGTHGVTQIKEAGGLAVVQEPASAKYDGMPRSAIATGFADHVLEPAEMPGVLIDHLRLARKFAVAGAPGNAQDDLSSDLSKVCGVLRARTGYEFQDYKEGTLIRRIQRRMSVLKIDDIGDYLERLRSDSSEIARLLGELLISVTSFFRDSAAFDILDSKVVVPMIGSIPAGGVLRAWVPGCATGEEAYSLAMLFHDRASAAGKQIKVQIFATDIDERGLEKARRGYFTEAAVNRVPDDYRNRYFRPDSGSFRVSEELREMCIFSTQNLIRDPPFSRLDIVSCRNLLIYLKPELQARIVPILHYALRPGGVLMLGPSENVTKHAKLFETIDGKWRIFRRRETAERPTFPLRALGSQRIDPDAGAMVSGREQNALTTVSRAERFVLDQIGPAYAVISVDRQLLYTGGQIDRYLNVFRGAATHDLVALTRPELRMDVRAVVHRSSSSGERAERMSTVVKGASRWRLRIECAPLADGAEGAFVLAFHDLGLAETGDPSSDSGERNSDVEALERELASTKQYLQTTAEELESSNEELKSANEELMSMNEELQSSNEELETSKEELQSVNEELETVNAELTAKVDELNQTNGDLQNLLASTQIATLFLDRNLRVRRFTPVAKEIFHLIEGDVGRSITDIMPRIDEPEIEHVIREVLSSARQTSKRVYVRGNAGRTFMMRVLPYRTHGDLLEGVVVTFVDISDLAAAQGAAERRAEQQDFLARLAWRIVRQEPIKALLQDTAKAVAGLLKADFVELLKRRPDSDDFVLLAQQGFAAKADLIVPGGLESQGGYTVQSNQPVIVLDLDKDERFQRSDLLMSHNVRSGISTVIEGPDGRWGVLGVFSKETESFAAEDVKFIQALANVLSNGLQVDAATRALEESQERLAAALEAGGLGVHDFDPRTGEVTWDRTVYELWGVPEGTPVDYDVFMNGLHPDDRAATHAAVERALDPKAGGHFEAEYRVINAVDHDMRWVRADGEVTFRDGEPVRLVGTVADVTEKKRSEEHAQLLMREVNHRAKNLLSVVQAIARQTSRDSRPEEFSTLLDQRLAGLSASHDLITQGEWRSVDLLTLIRSQLDCVGGLYGDRVTLKGKAIELVPAAVQAIGLAIHELATNAIKYGALSNEAGHVAVEWKISNSKKEGQFSMSWTERGGPPVRPPKHRGFGTVVVDRMASAAVRGEVAVKFHKAGVKWVLTAPSAAVLAQAPRPRGRSQE